MVRRPCHLIKWDFRWDSIIFVCICLLSISSTVSCDVTITIEEPNEFQSTGEFKYRAIETFNSVDFRYQEKYQADFPMYENESDDMDKKIPIQVVYKDITVNPADEWGGAGGEGNYATTVQLQPTKLSISHTSDEPAPNYFGLWASAVNHDNQLEFFHEGISKYKLRPGDLVKFLEGRDEYLGETDSWGQRQPAAFFNFFFKECPFDEIHIFGEGFETDNHSFGFSKEISGEVVFKSTKDAPPRLRRQPSPPQPPKKKKERRGDLSQDEIDKDYEESVLEDEDADREEVEYPKRRKIKEY